MSLFPETFIDQGTKASLLYFWVREGLVSGWCWSVYQTCMSVLIKTNVPNPTDDKGLPATDERKEPRSHCNHRQCSWTIQHRMCRGKRWDEWRRSNPRTLENRNACIYSFRITVPVNLEPSGSTGHWRMTCLQKTWMASKPVYCRHRDVCRLWNQVRNTQYQRVVIQTERKKSFVL